MIVFVIGNAWKSGIDQSRMNHFHLSFPARATQIKHLLNHLKHCTKNWSFPLRISSVNPQCSGDLVTFTEEILNGKLHFLCSEI